MVNEFYKILLGDVPHQCWVKTSVSENGSAYNMRVNPDHGGTASLQDIGF